MSYPISPNDPSLPEAWKKQPTYWLEIATLSRQQPEGWEADMWKLEELHPGWHVSHDIEEDWFDPLDDVDEPEEYEAQFAQLKELQTSYLQQAVVRAIQLFQTTDFRKAEGLAKIFAGRSGGFLTPEERQSLTVQINTPVYAGSNGVVRQAFVELEDGFAVAGAIFQEMEYPTYKTPFVSPINPVLTLIGREVVVCKNDDNENPVGRGRLELHENRLELTGWQHQAGDVEVGGWGHDFSDAEADGTPFEEVELVGGEYLFTIFERDYYQENYVEEEL
jgi:hypothetical protein